MFGDVPWIVVLWPVLMLGVIVVAAVVKYIDIYKAKTWRSVAGKVVKSEVQARRVPDTGGGTEMKNFASVTYEYELFGKKLHNSRISFGDDLGNVEIEETLARYPVGAPVTVYYNPRNPRDAVIDRNAPKGIFGCLAWGVIILLVGYAATLFGFTRLYDFMLTALPRPERAGFVLALSAFGLVAGLIILAIRRTVTETMRWPVVPGIVEKSEVQEFEGTIGDDRKLQTLYRTDIVYSYAVRGKTYRGTRLGTQAEITANFRGSADKAVARFKVGQAVQVSYNPKNASDALVDPRMPLALWLLFLLPIGCFIGAYFAAQ
jgi:hypothetical protein